MKIGKTILVIFATILFTSCVKVDQQHNCEQSIVASPCIDMTNVDPNALCTQEYAPVCGCDKVTYSNECHAAQNGVKAWVDGECCE